MPSMYSNQLFNSKKTMKRFHRKVIALQARVARRASQDLIRNLSEDHCRYREVRGVNYDLFKAVDRAKGARATTLAKIIREIIYADRRFGSLACKRGVPGGHTYNRIYGFWFENRCAFVRNLVGPFNYGVIQSDSDGKMYIPV